MSCNQHHCVFWCINNAEQQQERTRKNIKPNDTSETRRKIPQNVFICIWRSFLLLLPLFCSPSNVLHIVACARRSLLTVHKQTVEHTLQSLHHTPLLPLFLEDLSITSPNIYIFSTCLYITVRTTSKNDYHQCGTPIYIFFLSWPPQKCSHTYALPTPPTTSRCQTSKRLLNLFLLSHFHSVACLQPKLHLQKHSMSSHSNTCRLLRPTTPPLYSQCVCVHTHTHTDKR